MFLLFFTPFQKNCKGIVQPQGEQMSIELIDLDSDNVLNITEWLKNEEVGELRRHLEERILRYLFSNDPVGTQFQQAVACLAWIGTSSQNKSLLERDISELKLFASNDVIQCDLSKGIRKAARFLAKHKTEILVGAALVATGVGIAAVTGYALSVGVGGVIVAGAGSIFSKEEGEPNLHIPQIVPLCTKQDLAALQQAPVSPLPQLILPSSTSELLVTPEGIWANGQFYPNQLLESSLFSEELARSSPFFPYPNWPLAYGMESAVPGSQISLPESMASVFTPSERAQVDLPMERVIPVPSDTISTKEPKRFISCAFTIPGTKSTSGHIGWINGICNNFEDSKNSGIYLQNLAGGHTISGVYNCTHSAIADLPESAFLNHFGFSPVTAKLLQNEWKTFHEANSDQPNAKLLIVCHSQGTIHVKNALEGLPAEIRDRVIVVAIAVAAVVPKRLCFKAYNYASEKDIVHKFEPGPARPLEPYVIDDVIIPRFGDAPIDDRAELIILPAHSAATGIDHAFQSPTFQDVLERALGDYEKHGGKYLPEEKGK